MVKLRNTTRIIIDRFKIQMAGHLLYNWDFCINKKWQLIKYIPVKYKSL